MSQPDCERAEELISARLDRELSAGEAAELSAHLAGCAECRRAAEEHAALAGELGAAFRAEPLRAARHLPETVVRPRRGRAWLRLAVAAAALLAAAGVAYRLLAPRTVRVPGESVAVSGPVELAGGTVVAPIGTARLALAGPQSLVDQVIRLDAGEIQIHAAKAAPGRTAVRVETPLGNVETLGTVFRVRLIASEKANREGETDMRLRSMLPLTAVAILVSVDQGQVLVTGRTGPGPGAALAGEGVTVGASESVIRAVVTKVEEKNGGLVVTIPAGKNDGIREGFEFICKWKDWSGKAVSVADDSAVLEVKGEFKGKVALSDVAETKLTEVLAEVKGGDKPEPAAPVKVEPVEGLQLVLIKRENVLKYVSYVDKEGRPLRIGRVGGGTVTVPEGAVAKPQERKSANLVAQLKNVSDKAVVLNFTLSPVAWGAHSGPIKLSARDTQGKDVPPIEMGGPAPHADKGGPAAVTILKPGEVLEQQFQFLPLRFPEDGKYIVWATLEQEPGPEVLPGVKPWSGKLKSNEVEWDGKKPAVGAWGPGAGGGGDRVFVLPGGNPGPGQPAQQPNSSQKKEVF